MSQENTQENTVEITFEIENQPERNGIVALQTYLSDAAKRLGVSLETKKSDGQDAGEDLVVTVTRGADLLSTPTSVEMHKLTDEQRAGGERLADQARIQKAGEITVKVKEKVVEKTEADKERDFRRDFQKLPLEKKFVTLVQIEAVALSESLNFITNLPTLVGSKVVDVLASFGWQIEKNARHARRPDEHRADSEKK